MLMANMGPDGQANRNTDRHKTQVVHERYLRDFREYRERALARRFLASQI